MIDRDRFFVQHDQYIVGDRLEAQIKERLFEHGNRFVIGVEFSHLHLNRPSFFGGGDSIDPLAIPIVVEGATNGGTPCRECMPDGQKYDGRYDNAVKNNFHNS